MLFAIGCSGTAAFAGATDSTSPFCGCPRAFIEPSLVDLHVADNPVGYSPPLGPAVRFQVQYNQLDIAQAATPTYSNIGPRWSTDWLSFVNDNPQTPGQGVSIALRSGGLQPYSGFTAKGSGGTFAPEESTGDVLVLVSQSPVVYERRLSDGSKDVYASPDGSIGNARRVFLTKIVDKIGNALSFTYDGKQRMTKVTDAIGQVTTLQYQNTNPLLITGVVDPFGRRTTLGYDGSGNLSSIVDAVGMRSTFAYDASSMNMTAMRTPYGATNFTTYVDPGNSHHRYVEMTDPLQHTTHVEFLETVPGTAFSEAAVPYGMHLFNAYLNYRDTYVWDGTAFARAKGDFSQATIYHFLHTAQELVMSDVIETIKAPLDNRIWFNYPNQSQPGFVGTLDKPSAIGRVLPNGNTELYTITYNSAANPASVTDPIGRQSTTAYDIATGVDPIAQTQTTPSGADKLSSIQYNDRHEPISGRDENGGVTTLAYNGKGQPLTVRNALGQVVTFLYSANGYLTNVFDANHRTVSALAYDAVGRVASSTDSEGRILRYQYDNLDRLTRILYPDGTNETIVWDRLDVGSVTDRLGRTTVYTHDAARNLVAVTDPLGHVTKYGYDESNRLISLVDPMGKVTTWTRDIEGRITSKTLPDQSTTLFTYDALSRLLTRTDALGQVTTYSYTNDDRLAGVTYTNAIHPTPNALFGWDPIYPRLVSMSGGDGTTTFSYVPAGSPGGLQRRSVVGQNPNLDAIAFTFDILGRPVSETVDGQAETLTYDAVGRVIGDRNALGAFTDKYLGESGQLLSEEVGNTPALGTSYLYETDTNDRRLKSIVRGVLPLSYTTDPAGNVLSKAETNANESYSYDADNRLTAVTASSDSVNTQSSASSGSNPAYNRNSGSSILGILQPFTFGRSVSSSSTRTVKGQAAAQSAGSAETYQYDDSSNLLAASGPYAFSASANADNQLTSVTIDGTPRAQTYDKDGNLLNDGTRSYMWDAENRLLAITVLATGRTSAFAYDATGRRVAITDAGVTTQYLWCGARICAATNGTSTVLARYFSQGEIDGSNQRFYVRDRLGSVRAMLDATGAVKGTITYDAYGRTTAASGETPAFGFGGMFHHAPSGLYLTYYRAYNPEIGRWISRDPIKEQGGINLYLYVVDNPENLIDPYGLFQLVIGSGGAIIAPGAGGSFTSVIGINFDYLNTNIFISSTVNIGIGGGAFIGGGIIGGPSSLDSPPPGFSTSSSNYVEVDGGLAYQASVGANLDDNGNLVSPSGNASLRAGPGGGLGVIYGRSYSFTAATFTLGQLLSGIEAGASAACSAILDFLFE